jgi:Protein of unknown function (DUF2523)
MFDFFKSVLAFFGEYYDFLVDSFTSLPDVFLSMLKDMFVWVLLSLLDIGFAIVNFFFSAANIAVYNPLQYINLLPADVLNVLRLIKLGEALSIIFSAISLRFILNFIPFLK